MEAKKSTMQLNMGKTSIPLSGNFVIAFFLLTWLCMEAHEFSHYDAVIAQGGGLYAAFDVWFGVGSLSNVQSLIAVVAGPLTTFALIWIGLFVLLKSKRYGLLGFSLIFAAFPLARIYGIRVGDESEIANLSGVSPLLILLLYLIVVSLPLIIAYKSIGNRRRLLWFIFFLLVMPAFFFLAVLLPDHFLAPIVEESYETGVPLTLMVSGIPIIIIVADVIVALLFFGKYVKYLLVPLEASKRGRQMNSDIRLHVKASQNMFLYPLFISN